jgi:lipoprotein Spr
MIRNTLFLCIVVWFSACGPSVRFRAVHPGTEEQAEGTGPADLNRFVDEWIGTPYLYGGTDQNGVDCSGFTFAVYRAVYHISLPRQSEDQYAAGKKVTQSTMKPGDLVFFKGVNRPGIDHVGVYLGNGQFAHAATSTGVTISGLSEEYYQLRFAGARRYF